MLRGFALLSLLLVVGCGHNIGDSCQANVDCSPLGDRFCDVATPGGYCTIEDCGSSTCPSEAACIRFFLPILNEMCHFNDKEPLTQQDCKHADEVCVCDLSAADGSCIKNGGHCAPASTEKHWCERLCSHSSDCRRGYECRQTGTLGAEPLPSFDFSQGPVKFCAPIEPGNPPINTL